MNSTFNRRVRLLAFLFACISLFMCVFVYNSQKTIAIGTETETTYGQTTASVNFRVAPNTDCEIIYEIPVGTKFEILEYSGGWYRVRIDDVVGYVSGDYVFVNESGSRGAYVEKDDTIVYGGPSTASYVVTKLTAGQGINIKAMVGSWCYIVAGSYEGYVDYTTATELKALGVEIYQVLQDNDAYHALQKVDGLVMTGPTGTNVNDVAVALLKAE